MGFANSSAAKAFRLSNWRESVHERREIARTIVTRATLNGENLEVVLVEFRRAVGWFGLTDKDKSGLYVMLHDIRSIVGVWPKLPERDRAAFVDGHLVPSALAKQARSLSVEK